MGFVGVKDWTKEEKFVELVSDQNSSPEAPLRSKRARERRKQIRSQERSDCQRSDREDFLGHSH